MHIIKIKHCFAWIPTRIINKVPCESGLIIPHVVWLRSYTKVYGTDEQTKKVFLNDTILGHVSLVDYMIVRAKRKERGTE